jgi:hypothetical protein
MPLLWLQTFSGHLHKAMQRWPIGAPPGVPTLRPTDDNAGTGYRITCNASRGTTFRCLDFQYGKIGLFLPESHLQHGMTGRELENQRLMEISWASPYCILHSVLYN